MLERKIKLYVAVTILAAILLVVALARSSPEQTTKTNIRSNRFGIADATPTVSVINPGPDGYPDNWTAYSEVIRNLGTGDLLFYTNETSPGSTFFINVTVREVTAMYGWGIGLIYENKSLSFVSAWRPTDHVFSVPEFVLGWTIVSPPPVIEDYNSTHKILKIGCTYIMGDPEWTFNGTGTLCQIQFRIGKSWDNYLSFDPDWTFCYYYPTGQELPICESGHFAYVWTPIYVKLVNPGPARYPGTSEFVFYSNETSVGDTFVVNVTTTYVEDLIAWQVGVWYDPRILEGPGELFNETHALAIFSDGPFTEPLTYEGTLFQMTFKIVMDAPAECYLTFDRGPFPAGSTDPVMPSGWTVLWFQGPSSARPSGPFGIYIQSGHFVYNYIIPGDVDGNGQVDMGDITELCKAFGSTLKPDGLYWHTPPCITCPHSPGNDIDHNAQVDMADIITATRNFGKHYP